MGLQVEGNQYRYYDESGEDYWRPVSELEYITEGVIFDGEDYWCLSTLPQPASSEIVVCSSEGWIAR